MTRSRRIIGWTFFLGVLVGLGYALSNMQPPPEGVIHGPRVPLAMTDDGLLWVFGIGGEGKFSAPTVWDSTGKQLDRRFPDLEDLEAVDAGNIFVSEDATQIAIGSWKDDSIRIANVDGTSKRVPVPDLRLEPSGPVHRFGWGVPSTKRFGFSPLARHFIEGWDGIEFPKEFEPGLAYIVHVDQGKIVASVPRLRSHVGFSADERYWFFEREDAKGGSLVGVVDLASGEIRGIPGTVGPVVLSPDRNWLVLGKPLEAKKTKLTLWDARRLEFVRDLALDAQFASERWQVKFSPNSQFVLGSRMDSASLILWETSTGKEVAGISEAVGPIQIESQRDDQSQIVMSATGKYLARAKMTAFGLEFQAYRMEKGRSVRLWSKQIENFQTFDSEKDPMRFLGDRALAISREPMDIIAPAADSVHGSRVILEIETGKELGPKAMGPQCLFCQSKKWNRICEQSISVPIPPSGWQGTFHDWLNKLLRIKAPETLHEIRVFDADSLEPLARVRVANTEIGILSPSGNRIVATSFAELGDFDSLQTGIWQIPLRTPWERIVGIPLAVGVFWWATQALLQRRRPGSAANIKPSGLPPKDLGVVRA